MTVVLMLLGIAALLLLRVPVAFAFLGPGLVYLLATGHSGGLAMRLIADATASFPLLAIPLFILLGSLAAHAGIADRLFDFALALMGKVRGGLGYVSIGVSLGFSWMSGSAVADAAALGKIQVPQMEKHGYSRRFSLGVVGSSALIAPVMPPSIPAVIFAGLGAVSTGALFAASVIPAVLMAFGLAVVVFIWVRRQPDIRDIGFSWARVAETGKGVIAPLLAPVIILGGILGGFFTPTEAAAVGSLYMLVLGLVYKKLTIRDLPKIFVETVMTAAAIMLIVASAALVGYVFAVERIPQDLASLLLGLTSDPTLFLVLVALIMLILGTVVDAVAVLVLTVPMLMPIATELGVDPIVLGVLMILSLMIGLLTPPVGTVLYVMSSTLKVPVGEVFRGAAPFMIPMLAICLVIIFFPDFILWLPAQLGL
ncbi:TRAP transporter large permease [Zhihengliuella halotolerans]|uniref:TRAP transporter large permease n=1 Tax=Zhihengliuella halotolerans TaxID=370736 RepID=UPI000C7FC556|nr:TRAP transporter large permease [Zhihengliuella halotolerans]